MLSILAADQYVIIDAGGAVLYGNAAYETVQVGDITVKNQRFRAFPPSKSPSYDMD